MTPAMILAQLEAVGIACLFSPLHSPRPVTLSLTLDRTKIPRLRAETFDTSYPYGVDSSLQSDLEMTLFQGPFTRPSLKRAHLEDQTLTVTIKPKAVSAHHVLHALQRVGGPLHGVC